MSVDEVPVIPDYDERSGNSTRRNIHGVTHASVVAAGHKPTDATGSPRWFRDREWDTVGAAVFNLRTSVKSVDISRFVTEE
jgi:hypothetical protein